MSTLRHPRSPLSDRLHTLFSPPPQTTTTSPSPSLELHEHDILWSLPNPNPNPNPNPYPNPNPSNILSPPSSSRPTSRRSPADRSFGILAALPEEDPDSSHSLVRKTSISSASSSASNSPSNSFSSAARMVPAVPKLRNEQPLLAIARSAPVNVPLPPLRARRDLVLGAGRDDDGDGDGDDDLDDAGIMPPHEIVARSYSRRSPLVASSVLEGAGRTLKGRDLRQVRNAVFRQTGFLD